VRQRSTLGLLRGPATSKQDTRPGSDTKFLIPCPYPLGLLLQPAAAPALHPSWQRLAAHLLAINPRAIWSSRSSRRCTLPARPLGSRTQAAWTVM
jgi:hypothetical protein